MLDFTPSVVTPSFAFGPHDKVTINGIAYRLIDRREDGYVFVRLDALGVAESFSRSEMSHLVTLGHVKQERDALLPANAKERLALPSELLSLLPAEQHRRAKLREAAVIAFLEMERSGEPTTTWAPTTVPATFAPPAAPKGPAPGHVTFAENQKGVSFDTILGPWLDGALEITLTDPYIRVYHQMRNLMELLEVIALRKPDGEDVRFSLLTAPDPEDLARQQGYLEQIRDGIAPLGIGFSWRFDGTSSIHARHLATDTGWKILLDRGLDVFQRADINGGFSPANRHQRFRQVKAFEVTYLRNGSDIPS